MAIPTKVADRMSSGLKHFQPILSSAKARDVNESDTSMIVSDMMADLFGYDKYSEITRELCIRGTYCNLAARIEGKFKMITEVKAIGLDLKESYMRGRPHRKTGTHHQRVLKENGLEAPPWVESSVSHSPGYVRWGSPEPNSFSVFNL